MYQLKTLIDQMIDLSNKIADEIKSEKVAPMIFGGFSAAAILELRKEYLNRGGKIGDPTPQDIRDAFQNTHNRFPLQPIYTDRQGIKRFKGNAIIKWMFRKFKITDILHGSFSEMELLQFVMLMGHSLCYLSEISWVGEDIKNKILEGE